MLHMRISCVASCTIFEGGEGGLERCDTTGIYPLTTHKYHTLRTAYGNKAILLLCNT